MSPGSHKVSIPSRRVAPAKAECAPDVSQISLGTGAVLETSGGTRKLDQQQSGWYTGLRGRKLQLGPGPAALNCLVSLSAAGGKGPRAKSQYCVSYSQ